VSDLHDIDSCESAVEDIADDIQKIPEREKRDINRDGRYAEGIFGSKSEQLPKQKIEGDEELADLTASEQP
jgi:hypothetical protein